jgi:hypothetical protein
MGRQPMRKTTSAIAMTVSLLVLGSSIRAYDFSVTTPLTTGDSLPKKGSATYTGTYALNYPWNNVSGPVSNLCRFCRWLSCR